MEDAIFHLLKQKVHVSGVGRTDSGVHARRYVANFHADCTIPMDRLPYALNSFLPEDIAVSGAVEVPEDFDARFNCTKKEYAYYLFPSTLRDPFHARYAYRYNYPLDITKMQEGAQYFVGKQDFASVRSQGTPVKSTVRTIFWCEVEPVDDLIRIRVCGDGFLYNMVRAIAGTLTYVGGGKLAPERGARRTARVRQRAGRTDPACLRSVHEPPVVRRYTRTGQIPPSARWSATGAERRGGFCETVRVPSGRFRSRSGFPAHPLNTLQ